MDFIQAKRKNFINASTGYHAFTAAVASTSASNIQLLQLLAKADCGIQEWKHNGLFSCSSFSNASLMFSPSEDMVVASEALHQAVV